MRARNKTQRNKAKPERQASRRTTPVPEMLEAIIDLVNLVPPEKELTDVEELIEQMTQQAIDEFQRWDEARSLEIHRYEVQVGPQKDTPEYRAGSAEVKQMWRDFIEEMKKREIIDVISAGIEAVNQCLDGLPKGIRDYVWQVGEEQLDRENSLYEAMYRYIFVRTSREKLKIIAGLYTEESTQTNMLFYPALSGHARIMVGEDGTLSVANDDFADAVEGVNAKRIRECAICKLIFWAGRINQPCCSTACAHSLRNRRYRARYKDYLVTQHLKEQSTTATDAKPSKPNKGKTEKKS